MEMKDEFFLSGYQGPLKVSSYCGLKVAQGGSTKDFAVVKLTLDMENQSLYYRPRNMTGSQHLPLKLISHATLDLSKKNPYFTLYFGSCTATIQFPIRKDWAQFSELLRSIRRQNTSKEIFDPSVLYFEEVSQYLTSKNIYLRSDSNFTSNEHFEIDDDISPSPETARSHIDIQAIRIDGDQM